MMTKEPLLRLYHQMLLLRRFDELCMQLKMKDLIFSGYHPYYGQEAVAVGFCSELRREDVVLSTHRAHCHAVAKGSPAREILAEMMGRQTGVSGGLGGAMQFLHPENNFFCGSIVGSNLAIAPGVAMAMKELGRDNVCVCLFGDGASNTGGFHEGINLAAIWKLPVLFVCENNQYAEAMPAREFLACERVSQRSAGYGLKEITVDGNDVEATCGAASDAIAKCRAGNGPVLVEALTYRIRGHYVGDPEETYRAREEVEQWKARCPIKCCGAKLHDLGVEDAYLEDIDRKINQELDSDCQWALEQPMPSLEQAIDHVLVPWQ
jgi:TPP-dependent pyruvate/acetoin dehydrogenase alpha subunit